MLKIRPEQMESFEAEADAQLIERLITHLAEEHDEAIDGIEPETLWDMVEAGVWRARENGFETEAGIGAFVGIMFEMAPNFDEHPAVRAILRADDFSEEERLDMLVEQLTDAHWVEVEAMYDEQAWFPFDEEDE